MIVGMSIPTVARFSLVLHPQRNQCRSRHVECDEAHHLSRTFPRHNGSDLAPIFAGQIIEL
jgi:hypothetical protein